MSQRTVDLITPSLVSPAQWSEWQVANREREVGSAQSLERLLKLLVSEGLPLSRRRAIMCDEFYAAVIRRVQQDTKALEDVALCCLAPRLFASGCEFSLIIQAFEQMSGTGSNIEARLRKMQLRMS